MPVGPPKEERAAHDNALEERNSCRSAHQPRLLLRQTGGNCKVHPLQLAIPIISIMACTNTALLVGHARQRCWALICGELLHYDFSATGGRPVTLWNHDGQLPTGMPRLVRVSLCFPSSELVHELVLPLSPTS